MTDIKNACVSCGHPYESECKMIRGFVTCLQKSCVNYGLIQLRRTYLDELHEELESGVGEKENLSRICIGCDTPYTKEDLEECMKKGQIASEYGKGNILCCSCLKEYEKLPEEGRALVLKLNFRCAELGVGLFSAQGKGFMMWFDERGEGSFVTNIGYDKRKGINF